MLHYYISAVKLVLLDHRPQIKIKNHKQPYNTFFFEVNQMLLVVDKIFALFNLLYLLQ